MILTDSHLHTYFSSDSEETFEYIIKKANVLGLKELYFTDHMDLDFPEQYKLDFLFNIEEQQKSILEARKTTDIKLYKGIEVGLMPHLNKKIHHLVTEHSFDYVIGSVHIVSNMDPYYVEYWEKTVSEEYGIKTYLEEALKCIQTVKDFDSFGHLDYIVRYVPSKTKYNCLKMYPELIEAILKELIKRGKALEVNTSGYAKNGASNPNMDIVKLYLELGGELITIGSDAHEANNLGANFDVVANELKKTGLRYYTTFRSRKPILHSL